MMWKEKYRIGVDIIDQQHEELFRRVSDFLKVIQSKEDWSIRLNKVKETMNFMQEYVDTHFKEEEIFQEKINYPNLEEHKIAHTKFKEGVVNYVNLLNKEGFNEELVQEFGGKLMTWLIMHVAKMDQQIGEYVINEGGESYEG